MTLVILGAMNILTCRRLYDVPKLWDALKAVHWPVKTN